MQAVDDDHRGMAEELGKRETEFALKRPLLERQRLAAIAVAQAALAAYEKEQAPGLAVLERKKAETTAKLEADLKAYETTVLAKRTADWEKEKAASIVNRWPVLGFQDHQRDQSLDLDQATRWLNRRLGAEP